MAMAGRITGDTTLVTVALIANLVALALAAAELRQAQQHAAQAAATRIAATQLHAASVHGRVPVPRQGQAKDHGRSRTATAADVARGDFPVPPRPGRLVPTGPGRTRPRLPRGPLPPRRAGPGR
jgi:hypothetical protein